MYLHCCGIFSFMFPCVSVSYFVIISASTCPSLYSRFHARFSLPWSSHLFVCVFVFIPVFFSVFYCLPSRHSPSLVLALFSLYSCFLFLPLFSYVLGLSFISFIFSFSGCCSRVLPPFLALFSSLNYTSDRFFYLAWCIVSLLPFRFLPVPVPPSLSLSPPPLLSSNATSSLSVPPAGAPRLRISRRVWDQSHFLRHWSACQISQDEWLPSRPSPPAPGGVS